MLCECTQGLFPTDLQQLWMLRRCEARVRVQPQCDLSGGRVGPHVSLMVWRYPAIRMFDHSSAVQLSVPMRQEQLLASLLCL